MGLYIAGSIVDDPRPIWRAYAAKYPRTIREYDMGGRGVSGQLTAGEAWRSRLINSRLTRRECNELVARAAEPGCPWHDVPADADLADADPGIPAGRFGKAAALYWHFTYPERIHGVAVAKVHKVLHLKRPGLYPILDAKVKRLYRNSARPWVTALDHLHVTIDDSPPYWAAIRHDLLCNRGRLDAYRQQLAKDSDQTVAPRLRPRSPMSTDRARDEAVPVPSGLCGRAPGQAPKPPSTPNAAEADQFYGATHRVM